ncbi:MAG: TIGR04283 family arsenosugar biosynthesis glycosyltransferase [Burkholderiales bacterium]|nr:TIGR04283 family arsenosugar biosynthesis glycosyltransferase [Burkholderiales bacterium]
MSESGASPVLRLSIVVPALDEADSISATVRDALAQADEAIVVDGGSRDATGALAAAAGARVVQAPRGRASQMNAGAAVAQGDVLLFLHADCRLPAGAGDAVRTAVGAGARWGRFDVRLDSPRASLAVVGAMMNLRSRLSGIATGDQALFVDRGLWEALDGYAPIPLMEDVELCTRLRRVARCACLRERVTVSARRWETRGVVRTIVEMWAWRAAYALGVSPARLHRLYYGRR